jgi:hypothetical protein
MPLGNPDKKAARKQELQQRRDQHALKLLRDDWDIHGYRAGHGNGGYGITNNSDGSITVGDGRLGAAVTMRFPGAVATLEARRRPAPPTAVRGIGKPVTQQYYLTVRSAGAEAIIPVDGSNAAHLHAFVASFNTAAARAAAPIQDAAPYPSAPDA